MSNETKFKSVNEFEVILGFELRKRKFSNSEIEDIVGYYSEIINERTLNGENVLEVLDNYDPQKIAFLLEPEMRLKRIESETTSVTPKERKIGDKVESHITKLKKKSNPDSFKKTSNNFLFVIRRCFSVPFTIPLGIFIFVFFVIFISFYIVSISMGLASFVSIFVAIIQIWKDTLSPQLGIAYLGVYLIAFSVVCILFYYLGKLFSKLSKLSLKLIVKLNKKRTKEIK